MTPSALALSADGKKLFVVCSDANAIAQVSLADEHVFVLGFVPVGSYPTAVRTLPDGRIVVLNGRGTSGDLQKGSVSFIAPPDDQQLAVNSASVLSNLPSGFSAATVPAGIKHVILVVKGHQGYDQALGDVREGDGDQSMVVSGEKQTPNLHKLAREFVLLDNFYVVGDAAADGLNWSTAAIAPDYVQKLWPNVSGSSRPLSDFEGGDPTTLPPAGYLWDNALSAGLSVRNYGFWVENKVHSDPDGTEVQAVKDPQLSPVTDMQFRGPDPNYPDTSRAAEFVNELHEYEQTGNLPQLLLVRLANDSPAGAGGLEAVADNDRAVGMLAEALVKTSFWKESVLIVMEGDSEGVRDHVNRHRSVAMVISSFARRRAVESTMYNTLSVLHTAEAILECAR